MGGGNNKTPVTVKCARCGTEFTVPHYHWRNYTKAGKNFYCKECYKINRAEISKKIWKDMDPNKRADVNKKKAETRKNNSQEKKEAFRTKVKQTWANKSEEEKQRHSEIRRANTQSFWDNLTPQEYEDLRQKMSDGQQNMINSMTPEEREARAARLRTASHNYWAEMSLEEYIKRCQEMSDKRREDWERATSAQLSQRVNAISTGRRRYWDTVSPEERRIIGKQHHEWWDTLNEEDRKNILDPLHDGFSEWWNGLSTEGKNFEMKRRAEGYNEYLRRLGMNPNRNETDLINELRKHKIPFEYIHYNTSEHPDFHKLFPNNPVNKSDYVSPFHPWDFILHTLDGDVLVDIDGSIHDKTQCSITSDGKNGQYELYDYIAFKESQRPYQTDGLPAYAVLCYDDNLTENTPVINVTTNEKMSFKQFMATIEFMNMTEEERKMILKA